MYAVRTVKNFISQRSYLVLVCYLSPFVNSTRSPIIYLSMFTDEKELISHQGECRGGGIGERYELYSNCRRFRGTRIPTTYLLRFMDERDLILTQRGLGWRIYVSSWIKIMRIRAMNRVIIFRLRSLTFFTTAIAVVWCLTTGDVIAVAVVANTKIDCVMRSIPPHIACTQVQFECLNFTV